MAEQGIFEFPYVWHFNSYGVSWLKLLPFLVVVAMVSTEYSNRTLKQNLIDGLSKKEYIATKFITIVFLSLVTTLFVTIVSLLLGLAYSSTTEVSVMFSEMIYLVALFVKLCTFFALGLFFGILIKRSAFAMATIICWFIAEKLLRFLILPTFMDHATAKSISNFFPLQAMESLMPEPFTKMQAVQNLSNGMEIGNYEVSTFYLIVTISWFVLFAFGSYKLLDKRDL